MPPLSVWSATLLQSGNVRVALHTTGIGSLAPSSRLRSKLSDPSPDDTRSPLQALWREVAGDVEDQLRESRRIGIDLAVGGGHDRHVVGDGSIQCVQRRDHRLVCAVRPQRQIAQCACGTTVALKTYACAVAGGPH